MSKLTNKDTQKFVHQCVAECADLYPQKIALRFGTKTLTYRELNQQANQLAHYLLAHDVQPGSVVAVACEKGFDFYIALLASLKIGCAYLPLDVHSPQERLAFMLSESKSAVVLTQSTQQDKLLGAAVIAIDSIKDLAHYSAKNPVIAIATSDLAYAIYTSGSTGTPKAVLIEHAALNNVLQWLQKNIVIKASERVAQLLALNFDANILEWAIALTNGAELNLFTASEMLPYQDLATVLAEKQINLAVMTPGLLATTTPDKLSQLHTLLVGGDVLSQSLNDLWAEGRQLFNCYGPTETTIFSLVSKCQPEKMVTIGKPINNYFAYVLDKNLQLVPPGVPGELHISGYGLARGYLKNNKLTQTRFIKNSFAKQDGFLRLYKTGDRVCQLANGELQFLGRLDEQVKVRGYRIELGEIKAVLAKHPLIKQAAVKIDESHDSEKYLVAYYVAKKNGQLTAEILQKFLADYLPSYMVPSHFIALDKMPLTSNQKINRAKLPSLTIKKEVFIATDNLQNQLVKLWSELLQLSPEKIDVERSFFALGGHSLLMVRLLTELQKRFAASLDVGAFLQHPTVSQLVKMVGNKMNTEIIFQRALEDAKLAMGIQTVAEITKKKSAPLYEYILLTGATGFLGVHMLEQLLTNTNAIIVCLVRGKSVNYARNRLLNAAKRYHLDHIVDDIDRLKIIPGDLSQADFGLAERQYRALTKNIDTIYHAAADVHHLYDYEHLRGSNVLGTLEILKLATRFKNKPIHFISSMVCANDLDSEGHVLETPPAVTPAKHFNGYAMTKWVAERLLWQARERGVETYIYRPGNITGHSDTGACNAEKNHDWLLIKNCIQNKVAPDWDAHIEMTPVDVLSEAIIKLSLKSQADHTIYNLANPHGLHWREYMQKLNGLGFNLKLVAPQQWHTDFVIKQGSRQKEFPLAAYYWDSHHPRQLKFRSETTQKHLSKQRVGFPKNYDTLIKKYFDYLQNENFFTSKSGRSERKSG